MPKYSDAPIEILHGGINHSETADASVIWLHGLGADGNDFVSVVELLNLPNVRFILPHAPVRKVTLNNGFEMRAWYDLYGLAAGSPQDAAGIAESQTYIESLIANEQARGIPSNRIVLAGFSQGGAIALHAGLRQSKTLAGILALSTYLPLKANLQAEKSIANQATPIFMAHGTFDEVITLSSCRDSLATLQSQQYAVNWHEYPMAHSVCLQEIDDIRTFLLRVLPH